MKEFNTDLLDFPITASKLLVDTGISVSSSDMKRLVWGTTIMLDEAPLNCDMAKVFSSPLELKNKQLKIGRRTKIKFV